MREKDIGLSSINRLAREIAEHQYGGLAAKTNHVFRLASLLRVAGLTKVKR